MTRHFLVVGAQRCGTTWLHGLLAAHPQVAMARPARPEPKAFLRPEGVDLDAYRREFFAHATDELAWGEKTTSYLESPGVPDRVAATLGRPRVVVQLRDPVRRAVSNWAFSRDHGLEDRPLEVALAADLTQPRAWDRTASSVSPFAYVSRGRYVEDLARWVDRFEVRVQLLEEVRADPDLVGELYEWLGVDADFRPDLSTIPVHASEHATEEPDPHLLAQLRAHYADSDAALATLLGRDLPWPTRRAA